MVLELLNDGKDGPPTVSTPQDPIADNSTVVIYFPKGSRPFTTPEHLVRAAMNGRHTNTNVVIVTKSLSEVPLLIRAQVEDVNIHKFN